MESDQAKAIHAKESLQKVDIPFGKGQLIGKIVGRAKAPDEEKIIATKFKGELDKIGNKMPKAPALQKVDDKYGTDLVSLRKEMDAELGLAGDYIKTGDMGEARRHTKAARDIMVEMGKALYRARHDVPEAQPIAEEVIGEEGVEQIEMEEAEAMGLETETAEEEMMEAEMMEAEKAYLNPQDKRIPSQATYGIETALEHQPDNRMHPIHEEVILPPGPRPPPREALKAEGRPTWERGKYVEVAREKGNVYLGRDVPDIQVKGFSNVTEFRNTMEEIEEDFKKGAIDRKTMNSRLNRLYLIADKSRKGTMADKSTRDKVKKEINKRRKEFGLKPLEYDIEVN